MLAKLTKKHSSLTTRVSLKQISHSLAHKGHGGQDFLLQLLIIQQTTTNTTVLTTAFMANKNHPLGSLNKKSCGSIGRFLQQMSFLSANQQEVKEI